MIFNYCQTLIPKDIQLLAKAYLLLPKQKYCLNYCSFDVLIIFSKSKYLKLSQNSLLFITHVKWIMKFWTLSIRHLLFSEYCKIWFYFEYHKWEKILIIDLSFINTIGFLYRMYTESYSILLELQFLMRALTNDVIKSFTFKLNVLLNKTDI
jgi:hypothetical protein